MEPNLNKKLCKIVEHDISLETGNKRGKKVKTIAGIHLKKERDKESYIYFVHIMFLGPG